MLNVERNLRWMVDFKCTAGMCIYRERKARFQGVLEKDLASQPTKERGEIRADFR